MLKGTRDGILKRIQPISIHGQMSWDIFFTDVDDPDGQIHVARVGPEAVVAAISSPAIASRSNISSASRSRSLSVVPQVRTSAASVRSRLRLDPLLVLHVSTRRRSAFRPFRGAASIASTAAIPSTTRPKAVY